jgi:AcrR family transcriptional regulator
VPVIAKGQKVERIVKRAREVFGRYGYKRTSMNLIAEAAGMSRPALYQHFSGKSAVFRAVATDLADELIANSQLAAARTAASLTERLYEALAVKLEFVLDTVESGYRGELLSEAGGTRARGAS